MKRQLRLNNRAFSIIELMVVVAIIAVLASIGIPEYAKFQAKARQSEAKLALAALFTAEESFRQHWNQYSIDLLNIGFSVQGARLRYVTGFQIGQHPTGCAGYSTTGGAPVESASVTNMWSDGSFVNTASATWAVGSPSKPTNPITVCNAGSAFTAVAYGSPASSSVDPGTTAGDTWTINQTKLIQNTQTYLGN